MSEQAYEQRVTDLERKWTTVTNEWARVSIRIGLTQEDHADAVRDFAHDRVATLLLAEAAWEGVEAADISDIAYEAVEQAWRNR